MLTRRELLAGAGSAVAALALAGCGGDARRYPGTAAGPVAPLPPMRKGVSLIGDVNPYDDTFGVRPYLLGGSHPTTFVALWLIWPDVQPLAPVPFTREQARADLDDPAGPGAATLASLDAQIVRAKADGIEVALTLYQAFPDWTRAGWAGPDSRAPAQLARVPDDRSPDGPWAWLLDSLCRRYARGGAGNPSGAWVDWIQPMNEPNLTWWPQRSPTYPGGTIAGAVAELARSAATVAADVPGSPGLLLPATADVVGVASSRATPWDVFSDELLARLRGWRPRVPVGWAHHNYADVKLGPQADGRWRVERLLELQRAHDWPDPSVWLTEGGYQFGVRRDGWIAPDVERWVVDPGRTTDPSHPDVFAEQVAAIEVNWQAMAALPVRLWTQYQVNDRDVRFQSGLRGPVQDTPAGRVPRDPPYPAYGLWPTLAA